MSRHPPMRSLLVACAVSLCLAAAMNACTVASAPADDDNRAEGGTAGQGGDGGAGGMGGVQPPACDAWVPRWQEPETLVGPTGLQARLVELMGGATNQLSLMMYQLSCTACVDGLIAARERGVQVRVLLDYEQTVNQSAIAALEGAGIEVKAAPAAFNHAHAKVMILDGEAAVVMSANMNVYSMSSERNYGVIDRDPQDVAQLMALFERDWTGNGAVDTSCTRLVLSPENARERLVELINSATTNLDLAVMYISDSGIKNAIKAKIMAGVPTRILFAHPEWIDSNPDTAQELSAAGAETKYLYSLELHAKLIMADGIPFVGSENMSYNALENNREVGLFVTEPSPAAIIQQQFEADWAAGEPAP